MNGEVNSTTMETVAVIDELDTELFDVIGKVFYWNIHGYSDGTIFSPMHRLPDGKWEGINDHKCRDVMCGFFWVALHNKFYTVGHLFTSNNKDAVKAKEMLGNANEAGTHTKLLVMYMNAGRIDKGEPASILKLLNAMEEHLDNVFNGERTYITETQHKRCVVYNMPNKWASCTQMASLYMLLIRFGRGYNNKKVEHLHPIYWLFDYPHKSAYCPHFGSDLGHIREARERVGLIKEHGLLLDRLKYRTGKPEGGERPMEQGIVESHISQFIPDVPLMRLTTRICHDTFRIITVEVPEE